MKIIKDYKPYHIASLIGNKIPVCVFQGRSEAGPRALGNRSIIFDPTLLYGRRYFNKIKGREYWRPFAGTIMHEYAHEWFEMKSLNESPYMSYAVKVKESKKDYIPAILHNDGTCRIQTLKREQNPYFYDIISGYYESFRDSEVKIPIIGNTSFNVAGDPLVETLDDAIKTLEKSQLEFLYLPETSELIHIPN